MIKVTLSDAAYRLYMDWLGSSFMGFTVSSPQYIVEEIILIGRVEA